MDFLEEFIKLMREAVPESYFLANRQREVQYPYATFSYNGEGVGRHASEFVMDVDVFDNQSALRVEEACQKLRQALHFREIFTESCFLRVSFSRQNTIPVLSETLHRRNMQFIVKIDWRV
ncbi:MAG: hypothetical protein FWF59_08490 [Turicibacter sp.]|nr:hypothetical protein [Turicibacter sp.]